MAYETCENCGCRVYNLGCVNCNEEAYIAEQDTLTDGNSYTLTKVSINRRKRRLRYWWEARRSAQPQPGSP